MQRSKSGRQHRKRALLPVTSQALGLQLQLISGATCAQPSDKAALQASTRLQQQWTAKKNFSRSCVASPEDRTNPSSCGLLLFSSRFPSFPSLLISSHVQMSPLNQITKLPVDVMHVVRVAATACDRREWHTVSRQSNRYHDVPSVTESFTEIVFTELQNLILVHIRCIHAHS